ncbi:MAG: SpoIIE family protein phosphatase [Spirochaetales bacterium]|nr:SpoIIE family protein phosphatase [Leptospiraceae bacterium]MCP5482573.1 SpoIIE family protein phosphatase [Spirochaetales bacterium]MCP5485163.1 SpoIIE family protein phosphatase [Spirochaetales bacterium]
MQYLCYRPGPIIDQGPGDRPPLREKGSKLLDVKIEIFVLKKDAQRNYREFVKKGWTWAWSDAGDRTEVTLPAEFPFEATFYHLHGKHDGFSLGVLREHFRIRIPDWSGGPRSGLATVTFTCQIGPATLLKQFTSRERRCRRSRIVHQKIPERDCRIIVCALTCVMPCPSFRSRALAIVLMLLALTLTSACSDDSEAPQAVDGRIDLSHWDFEAGGPVALRGEWLLYPRQLRESGGEESMHSGTGNHGNPATPMVDAEFGTYVLEIIASENSDAPMMLYLPAPRSSYRLWCGDRLLIQQLVIGRDVATTHPLYRSQLVALERTAHLDRLVLEVSGPDRRGAFPEPPLLGTAEQLTGFYARRIGFDVFIVAGFFVGALYHLALFLWRRNEPAPLLFGLMCLFLAVAALLTGEGIVYQLPGFATVHGQLVTRVVYCSVIPPAALFVHFVLELYPRADRAWSLRLVYGISGVFVSIVLIAPPFVLEALSDTFRLALLLAGLYVLFILIRPMRVRRIGARTLFASVALFLAVMIYGLFARFQGSPIFDRPVAFLFCGALAMLLAHRSALSHGSLESLSRKLDRRLDVHGDLTNLHAELDAARTFQQSLIPESPPTVPGLHIAAHYRAMQIVGGDFYDFRSDGRTVGALIADVSGHGIPAALIVSMLKLAFWQDKDRTPQPGTLFPAMNRLLLGNTGVEFVTGAYVLIDPRAMEVSVTNAGHPPVLLWRKGRRELLELRPVGRLLGMFEEPVFEVERAEIQIGDRILMYTDGLFESPNEEGEQYGVDRFRAFLDRYSHLPVDLFVHRLVNTVVRWSGGEDSIPDDIALIAIDVEGVRPPDDIAGRASLIGIKSRNRARNALSRAWKSVGGVFRRKT